MIQLQALSYILDSKDTSFIILNNLSDEFFSDYKNEFNYIKNHINKYGNIPDKESFLSTFRDFELVNVKESKDYLLDELYKDKNTRMLASTFNKIRSLLLEDKIDEAMTMYTHTSQNMSKCVHLDSVDITKDLSRYDTYIERSRDLGKAYVKTGFKELDDIIGGWDRNEEYATLVARSNVGKCLEKGTKILMADGTLKCVEDVKVGDKVQSLNQVNTVLALHNGKSKGYKIIPKVGYPFTVSENHILTVMQLNDVLRKGDIIHTTDNTFSLKDISIEEYLSYSKNKKAKLRLYRPDINYDEKDLRIPPYILGLWLGDGTSCRVSLTNIDPEIINCWLDWGKSLGYNNPRIDRDTYDLTDISNKGHRSVALELFRSYDLISNKHIPLDYLTSSRQQRLELLAGILDTDGYLSKTSTTFSLCLKSKELIEQIAQLARGLNFRVGTIKERVINNKVKGLTSYYTLNICGDLSIIPTKIKHKQAKRTTSKRYLNLTGFKVEEIPNIEYYGFMTDGDHRYMLWDNTLTHNTWMLLKTAVAAAEQGLTVGIYSGEMSVNKVGYRIDTLLSHISNRQIIQGNIEVQNTYKVFIDSLADKLKGKIKVLTPNAIGGPAGVTALRAFIEKDNLDMLCIDQHSLLEDDRKAKNPVEKAANISKDIKNLQVMERIPIITVSQQNRESTENGLDTRLIAQSDRIGQDSTVVLFFEKKDNILTVYLAKSRDSVNEKKLQYAIDFDRGIFTYIPTEDDGLNGQDCEQVRMEYELDNVSGDDVF